MSWYPDPAQPPEQPFSETIFADADFAPSASQVPDQPASVPDFYAQPSQIMPPLQSPYGQPAEYIPLPSSYEQPAAYGFVPPLPGPRPLDQAILELPRQYFKVLTRPGVQTFIEEQSKAEWGIIWLQLLFVGVVGTIISILHLVLSMGIESVYFQESATLSFLYSITTSGPSVLSIIDVVIVFFVVVGIQYLLAKAFRGNGNFKQQGYNYLLFYAPLTLLSNLLGLVPVVGFVVVLGAGIYQIVLNVFSIMAAHRLGGGKATAVVLIPVAVLTLLVIACAAVVFVLLFSVFSHRVI